MAYAISPLVTGTIDPPIAEVGSWIAGRTFPADKPLLNLSQAVPSYAPAPELTRHLAGLVDRPDMALYTQIVGLPELREALVADIRATYGGAVPADRALIAAGCNQAFCLALMAVARAGDEVILPVPYYFNHQMWLDMLGVTAAHLRFRADRGGVPDPADAAALIGPRTRAIVLVTPNNPTGAVYPPEVIEAFFELAKRHGLALVLDETYRDFLGEGERLHGLFARPDWEGTLVHLYSFSKAYALTGYRVGALVAGEAMIQAATKIMDTVAICAPRIGQEAALYGVRHLKSWTAEKAVMMGERMAALKAAFSGNRHGYRLISAGAYFGYVEHPFGGTPAKQVAKRLADEQNVLVVPGSRFGPGQERCLRFAYANAPADAMTDLADRLAASQR